MVCAFQCISISFLYLSVHKYKLSQIFEKKKKQIVIESIKYEMGEGDEGKKYEQQQ